MDVSQESLTFDSKLHINGEADKKTECNLNSDENPELCSGEPDDNINTVILKAENNSDQTQSIHHLKKGVEDTKEFQSNTNEKDQPVLNDHNSLSEETNHVCDVDSHPKDHSMDINVPESDSNLKTVNTDMVNSSDQQFENNIVVDKTNITPDNEKQNELKMGDEAEDSVESALDSEQRKENSTEEEKDKEENWLQILGHDKLKKKVVKQGKGYFTRPSNGQVVTFRCCGTLSDGSKVDQNDQLVITVGDGDVIQALDLCLPLMELEECCILESDSKYAYGSIGSAPDIPKDSHITFEIELLSIEDPPEYGKLEISERIKKGAAKRERGNWWYSHDDHTTAINSYNKALHILVEENISGETSEVIAQLKDERIKCYNNLGAAQLKIEAWDAAIKSCDSVIRIQPENVKALFRKGKCLSGKGELEAAIAVLKKALKIEPETKIIHNELTRLVNKHKAQNQSAKEMYQRMLGTNKSKSSTKTSSSSTWIYFGGAVAAALVSVGLVAYSYMHL